MNKHEWTVILRDDQMGFQKQLQVEAVGASQAYTFAGDQLVKQGYDRRQFEAVLIQRGARVRDRVVA